MAVAYLESLSPGLAEAACDLLSRGADSLVVQPLLLGEGQHWREAVSLAEGLARRWPGVSVRVGRPLARHPGLTALVARRVAAALEGQPAPWGLLLVKAYTRYDGGDLGWARDLASAVARALGRPCRAAAVQSGPGPEPLLTEGEALLAEAPTLAVFPCLLFPGKILRQDVLPATEALRQRHPDRRILLLDTIGSDQALTTLLWERVREVLEPCPR